MKVLAALFFFVLLAAPPLARMAGVLPDQVENRALARRPPLELGASLQPAYFEQKWAGYLRDQLPFREVAAQLKARISFHFFRESPNARVLVGKDGFLFYDKEIDRGCDERHSVEEMAANARAWADDYAGRGGRFLLVLVPDKAMVYGEQLNDAQKARYACASQRNGLLR
ncbi:MAG: hypothetical protein ABW051_00845, partial [Burkholderiaceae bacterium]